MNGFPGFSSFDPSTWGIPGDPVFPYVETTTPSQVYTGTGSEMWATDTPALIPQVPVAAPPPPTWGWDPQAPLDFSGLNFADEPVSPAPISSAPVQFAGESPLDFEGLNFPSLSAPGPVYPGVTSYTPEPIAEGIVFPLGPVSPDLSAPAEFNWENPAWGWDPQAPLDLSMFDVPAEPGTGPLESIWGFVGDVAKGIGDAAKFVFDHMDIGVSYQGDFGGVKTQKAYYSSVGAPGPTILGTLGGAAPSVRTSVSTAGGGGSPPMTEEERLYREALGQTQADSDKFILYAGGAFLAYKLLTK